MRHCHRAPELDQESISLSNEYMDNEDHYGYEYDVDTVLAYHEGQGEHPSVTHSTDAYHPHQYLPYQVPDHVRVDTRPTSPHILQQLCDEAVLTSATSSMDSLPPPHPWTTVYPYTVDAPAGETHYQPITISPIVDDQGQAGSSSGVIHSYHPLHYLQPNWHDKRYYWGYGNHEVTWTLAAFNEY